jgi:hypothetical protein
MNVHAALVANPQPAKSPKPPEGSFDDPTPAAMPFVCLGAVFRDACSNASPAQPGTACS